MSSRLTFQADSEAPAAGPLRALFVALTQAALASTLSAGCDGETSEQERTDAGGDSGVREPSDARVDAQTQRVDAGVDAGLEPGTTAITCSEGMPDLTPPLKTTRPIEYLGVFRSYRTVRAPSPDASVDEPPSTYELMHQGQACSGVANPAECQSQLAALKVAPSCSGTICPAIFVVQEAGALSRLTTRAELLALLGVIDSPAEAVLLAAVDGSTLCPAWLDGPEQQGATIRAVASGYAIHAVYESCGEGKYRDDITVDADGKVTVVAHVMFAPSHCAIGRRPDGLHEPSRARYDSRRGAYLAECAGLEAASVFAFEKLARELSALGAPRALIDAAYDAQQDEVRHTRDVSALARAQGAEPSAPVVAETPLRSRLALALDNISEGCVRETFGALLATYQAQAAHDAQVRAVMRTIAEDEARHAALSWKLQAWLEPQLSQQELAQVHAQRAAALATLQAELACELSAADRSALGLPDASVAIGLLAQLERALPRTPNAEA